MKKIWRKFFEKISQCRKKTQRGPLNSPGIVCYVEKEENLFSFSWLGQMIQFGTINFRRTFKNCFCQVVWIEKKSHYNSCVSLHGAATKMQEHGFDTSSFKNVESNYKGNF